MNHLSKILISSSLLVGLILGPSSPALARAKATQLPTFDQIKKLPTKKRQIYLNKIAKMAQEKEYRFLYKYLVVKDKKKKRKVCLPLVFGPNQKPKGKKSKMSCKQDVKKAAALFDSTLNAPAWMTLQTQLTIDSVEKRSAKKFLNVQSLFFKKLSKAKLKKKKEKKSK